jgi:hypothetical protein
LDQYLVIQAHLQNSDHKNWLFVFRNAKDRSYVDVEQNKSLKKLPVPFQRRS